MWSLEWVLGCWEAFCAEDQAGGSAGLVLSLGRVQVRVRAESDGGEGLVEVGDEVVHVLRADGEPDGALVDALVGKLGFGQL